MGWKYLVVLAPLLACGATYACNMAMEPPRQNEHWTIPPTRYGETSFEGLRAPPVEDGGEP